MPLEKKEDIFSKDYYNMLTHNPNCIIENYSKLQSNTEDRLDT